MYIVYKITNKINGKAYVGQTTQKLNRRRSQHLHCLRNNTHGNPYLQNAYNKYGEDNFIFSIIDSAQTFEELDEKEKKYINILGYYNMDTGKHRSGKIRRRETLVKIGLSNKGKLISKNQKEFLSILNTGSNHPQAKLSDEDVYFIKFLCDFTGIKGPNTRLGEKFNVDRSVICRIRNNLKWTHITKDFFKSDEIDNIKNDRIHLLQKHLKK